MIRIARERELVKIAVHDLRDYTVDKHRQVDDMPYGGGPGMVMKPEPFHAAVTSIGKSALRELRQKIRIIIFTPRGRVLTQPLVEEFTSEEHLIILCGRYEGVDERVHAHIATDEISVGDYVVSGAEIPAMILVDAIVRLLPGVLGGEELSLAEESFTGGLLEYPHYTRPAEFMGWQVPDILLSGHHTEISKWRRRERLKATFLRRPDLLRSADLTDDDRRALEEIERELG
ncbi:MAG: tRNA (guanosine(37)-N1)-methyltransferase TrmD [Actinobacteria bacterium]|nr:tRNA (guanosine(37)-N1)-methyltransferase TrmD [Actinomycetota bacterium]